MTLYKFLHFHPVSFKSYHYKDFPTPIHNPAKDGFQTGLFFNRYFFLSSFLEWQYWGLPCFLGWLNLKFDISKKQKMMHRSFQTFNLQPILHLITSIHLLFFSLKISSLKQQSTTTSVFTLMGLFKTYLYPYENGFMEIQFGFQAARLGVHL